MAEAPPTETKMADEPVQFHLKSSESSDEPQQVDLRSSDSSEVGKEVQEQPQYRVTEGPEDQTQDEPEIHLDEAAISGEKARARTIMVAVDESDGSFYALQYTVNAIATKDDTIVLLNAYPNVDPAAYLFAYEPNWLTELQDKHQKHSQNVLRKLSKAVEKLKMKVKTLSKKGDARDVVQDAVKTVQPDLLVIGSRGLGVVKRTFLGSVSDFAAHHVDVPVLIVKASQSAKPTGGLQELIPGMEKLGRVTAQAA